MGGILRIASDSSRSSCDRSSTREGSWSWSSLRYSSRPFPSPSSRVYSRLPMLSPCTSTSQRWYSSRSRPISAAISSSPGIRCSRCSAREIANSQESQADRVRDLPLLRAGDRELDLLGFLAPLPRCPVQTAQAVQNGAPDLVLGVGLQLDVVRRIVLVHGRDQSRSEEHTSELQSPC